MAPIPQSINMLAPSWRILYPKVLELSLRLVGFSMSLCPWAYLRVIPQRFFNSVWLKVSDNDWRVIQHLCPGPLASYSLDRHPLSLYPLSHYLSLPRPCLGGILGILMKPFATGPLCWGGSNILPTLLITTLCLCILSVLTYHSLALAWEVFWASKWSPLLLDPSAEVVLTITTNGERMKMEC